MTLFELIVAIPGLSIAAILLYGVWRFVNEAEEPSRQVQTKEQPPARFNAVPAE